MTPEDAEFEGRVEAVRAFNRFYTRHLGVLRQGLLDSPFSLTEARVLYELGHRDRPTASVLGAELSLDAGYLSRLLRGLARRGLIRQTRSAADGRARVLMVTAAGRRAIRDLEGRARRQGGEWLGRRGAADQERLVSAMRTIEGVLSDDRLGVLSDDRRAGGAGDPDGTPTATAAVDVRLRGLEAGDLGWIVERHGTLYAAEYGWDWTFEALVARIVARFADRFQPARERAWIATVNGRRAGSVLLTCRSRTVAQLRLLLVEPWARGHGIGARLVGECEAFARAAGYRRIRLWTNSVLHAARRIYERAGYRLLESSPHESFGAALIGQTWELDLRHPAVRAAGGRLRATRAPSAARRP